MAVLSCNGVDIHYEVSGGGTQTLVFVHGYMGALEDWQDQVEAFSPEFRLLTLDNRGHGQSESPQDRGAYQVADVVADTIALIDQLGIDRFHLLGHSIGGAVVQEIGFLAQRRISSLILADTTDYFGDHDEPGGSPPYISPTSAAKGARRAAEMSAAAIGGTWDGLLAWRGSAEFAGAQRANPHNAWCPRRFTDTRRLAPPACDDRGQRASRNTRCGALAALRNAARLQRDVGSVPRTRCGVSRVFPSKWT